MHSVLVNSSDGKLYRWDLWTNTFTQEIRLTAGILEAYTPTFLGADGTVYAINDATLLAVAGVPEPGSLALVLIVAAAGGGVVAAAKASGRRGVTQDTLNHKVRTPGDTIVMSEFDPATYGPKLAPLVRELRLNELGPGTPDMAARPQLAALTQSETFAPHRVRDRDMANGCFAGLWLAHDFLDESHKISQEIGSPTGSYWHGLMHRGEPDFESSLHCFRRVGRHPVFAALRPEAASLAQEAGAGANAAFLGTQSAWDPFAFIELCEAGIGSGSAVELLCRRIHQCERQLFFDYCYRQAIGQPVYPGAFRVFS